MHFSDFPRVGDLFLGRYRVEAVLGAGGFARVYRAVQKDLERKVAIKVMRPAVDTTRDSTEETIARIEEVEERFRREAKVISKFRSPHTVVVHDYGRTNGGLLYMTLEYVDGQTVGDLIKSHAPIDPARVVHIIKQVVRSLHEAHSFDILHRDIKPQNVMVYDHLDQTDLVKVLDFGIAKLMEVEEEAAAVEELTTDGVLVGTPRYMSPEQIRGDRLTAASDVYSLGLVAYEMLTGAKAVDETTTMRIIARHLDPSPLRIPPDALVGTDLRAIVERMISKEPGDRHQSARDLLKAFNEWDPDEPVVVPESLEFDSDVAETVKFEAQDPAEMAETTEPADEPPEDDAADDESGARSVPRPSANEEPDDPTLLTEREPEEMFFAADTQMLDTDELPDDEAAVPRAQFLHPTEERGETTGEIAGEITGELRQDRRAAWLPIAVVAVAAVLLLSVGVAFMVGSGEEEPSELPNSADEPSADEPSIAAVDPADDTIEVAPIDDADDELANAPELTDDELVNDDEVANDESTTNGEHATDDSPRDDEQTDDEDDEPAVKAPAEDKEPQRPVHRARRPKKKEKEKEKRRFFPVE